MGTSAVAKITKNGEVISNILVSSDGYLDGFGNDLLSILKRKHVNGYSNDRKEYHRVGNFVALVVAKCVINKTESSNRVNELFGKEESKELSCGLVELVNEFNEDHLDFLYEIDFNCTNQDPQPPKVKVKSYSFDSGWLSVKDFEKLIDGGIPEEDEE